MRRAPTCFQCNFFTDRGRGGRAAPRQQRDDDSDDDVPKQIVPARGAGGRGRQPDTESDEDDEDYDDDEVREQFSVRRV